MQFISAISIIFAILFYVNTAKTVPNKPKSRIVNGIPAIPGQLPWQVILKKNHFDDLHCGGSIITSKWVLTAGHCTYKLNLILIVFGTIHLNQYSSWIISNRFFIHPEYNNENLNNDVSLILLPQPLVFSETIQPISLVSKNEINNEFVGTLAIIAGFGYTNDEYLDPSDSLLFAPVLIMDRNRCAKYYGNDAVTESVLCSEGIDNGSESICTGDSGGPLIAKDSNGNLMQIGIASFVALDACNEGYPSAYARLTSFLDFINKTIDSI